MDKQNMEYVPSEERGDGTLRHGEELGSLVSRNESIRRRIRFLDSLGIVVLILAWVSLRLIVFENSSYYATDPAIVFSWLAIFVVVTLWGMGGIICRLALCRSLDSNDRRILEIQRELEEAERPCS